MEKPIENIHGAPSEGAGGAQTYRNGTARIILGGLLTIAFSISLAAQDKPADLTTRSIEDLMDMPVTSVSKTQQTLSRTAAAVFVITQEDIRRSGATNIPDLLRMVPGMDVGQINANTWAISARGLNEEFSDKLLVMVDGRSVYTPTFAGVFWDSVNVPLEDIERIEVIRGPGGSIWGSNAVNGVINILTKDSSETRGGIAEGGCGTLDHGFGTLQYGDRFGSKTNYRAYLKYFNEASQPDLTGKAGQDGWHMLQGGFRADSNISTKDGLTVEGDLYGGRQGEQVLAFGSTQPTPLVGSLQGGYLQAMWTHSYSTDANSTLQISYDHGTHNLPFRDSRGTWNANYQYHFNWRSRQDVVVGGDYRYTSHLSNSSSVTYSPADHERQVFDGFAQDEITAIPDHLHVTLGLRLEHNEYSGFVALPDFRVAWQPNARQTLWGAVSAAKRTPSSGDTSDFVTGAEFPSGGLGSIPARIELVGNPNFHNERLLAYQAGYRSAPLNNLTFDLTAYFNKYNSLRTIETETPYVQTTPPVVILPFQFRNEMHGESQGVEIAANWKVTTRWTLSPGYAFERLHMHLSPTSVDTILLASAAGGSPDHSAQLRSHVDLWRNLSWDASAYFVGRLPPLSTPAYTRLDSGVTWLPAKNIELSVVGQNLESDHRLEYPDSAGLVATALVKRSVYGKLSWKF